MFRPLLLLFLLLPLLGSRPPADPFKPAGLSCWLAALPSPPQISPHPQLHCEEMQMTEHFPSPARSLPSELLHPQLLTCQHLQTLQASSSSVAQAGINFPKGLPDESHRQTFIGTCISGTLSSTPEHQNHPCTASSSFPGSSITGLVNITQVKSRRMRKSLCADDSQVAWWMVVVLIQL